MAGQGRQQRPMGTMLAAWRGDGGRFIDDAGFSGIHLFSLGEEFGEVDSRQLKVESWGK